MDCPKCFSSDTVIIDDSSELVGRRTVVFHYYECLECEFNFSDEPDWDSMPGGHDDY